MTVQTALLTSLLLLAAAQTARKPGVSAESRYVALRMAELPANLGLSHDQAKRLRSAFWERGHKEAQIMRTVHGWFRQRHAIAPLAQQLIQQEMQILTPKQFQMLRHSDHLGSHT